MKTQLFTPIQLGKLEVANRIGVPPMCQWVARDGHPQPYHFRHYTKLADSGAGLVIIEATATDPWGRISPNDLGLWSDEFVPEFAELFRQMKETNPAVKIGVQIAHAGRKAQDVNHEVDSYSAIGSDRSWKDTAAEKSLFGNHPIAPSAIRMNEQYPVPRELKTEEIPAVIQTFADAARRAKKAGADTIQLHAAHGYLIHEFLSPLSNKRTDIYGGSLENRMRFGLEVVKATVEAVGPDFPVGIRVSATDWLEGGWDPESTVEFLNRAKALGVSWIDVSTGGLLLAPIPVRPGYQLPFAAEIRRRVNLPVYGVGLITNAFQAETVLAAGAADAVSVGRAMLTDPNWGWHAARELRDDRVNLPAYIRYTK